MPATPTSLLQPVTLPELAEAVAVAMADWPEPANGQVRAVPDLRTLRWYGTTGLLDKPLAWRGRTGLYGERHRLQVLAVKRLQRAGWPLERIQEALLAASDPTLARIAAGKPPGIAKDAPVPAGTSPGPSPSTSSRRSTAFWAQPAPLVPSALQRHLALPGGASLVLPGDRDLDGLDAALAPLTAWLTRTSGDPS